MYLHLRDLDTVMKLYDRLKTKEDFEPNKMIINTVFEAALRLKDSDKLVEVLEDFVKYK